LETELKSIKAAYMKSYTERKTMQQKMEERYKREATQSKADYRNQRVSSIATTSSASKNSFSSDLLQSSSSSRKRPFFEEQAPVYGSALSFFDDSRKVS
jgi:hypothetical protein